MLGVALFIALWVVLALGLVSIAVRGGIGARPAPRAPARRSSRAFTVTFVVIFVGFGVVLPAVFLTGNHANASAQVGGIKLNAAEKTGRELFGEHCAVCHTLAAANAIGKVGPNLDQLMPPALLVLNTINNGCLQSPPPGGNDGCLGYGTMPSQVVQGKQAQDVADFVSKVAGKE